MTAQNFYDSHFHAMNMAHPNILAFARRINWQLLLLASPLAPIAAFLGIEKVKKVENLLSVMENDVGSLFMLVEYYLKANDLVKNDVITIDNENFDRIVITPLLMDFGYKNILTDTFYKIPPQKPIVSQAEDVFNGITDYCSKELHAGTSNGKTAYWIVPRTSKAIFEIYPFLGINTKNYERKDIEKLLNKYFSDYQGRYEDFKANLGKFKGDIITMGSNFFAGIKLYPPIGFDPWPTDPSERAKVECLFEFCCAKKIPVTVHCSDGGFVLDKEAAVFTSPDRWALVMSQKRFETLNLNFAHFGKQSKKKYLIISQHDWRDRIVGLIKDYPNVYTDFSYLGLDDAHYQALEETCKANPFIYDKLLFGSDFMINLLDMESYNGYLEIFSATTSFAQRKKTLCNINPERFLWQQKGA